MSSFQCIKMQLDSEAQRTQTICKQRSRLHEGSKMLALGKAKQLFFVWFTYVNFGWGGYHWEKESKTKLLVFSS